MLPSAFNAFASYSDAACAVRRQRLEPAVMPFHHGARGGGGDFQPGTAKPTGWPSIIHVVMHGRTDSPRKSPVAIVTEKSHDEAPCV